MRIVRGPVQTRLTSLDTRDLHEPLRELFEEQKTAFKVNVSYGFILKEKQENDVLRWANSDWVCELVTNATFFINRIIQHPIGCVGVNLPIYLKRNKAVVGLEKDHHNATYNDNLCLFRCLALLLGREAAALYAEYMNTRLCRCDDRGSPQR